MLAVLLLVKSIIFLLITLAITSCGKDFTCPKEPVVPAYIGYAPQEVDTIIIERYAKGTAFSQRVDTFLLFIGKAAFIRHGDTTIINAFDQALTVEHDIRVINPFDRKIVSVSGMQFEMKEGHTGGLFGWDNRVACTSPLISYERDNVPVVVANPGNGGNVLFIRR